MGTEYIREIMELADHHTLKKSLIKTCKLGPEDGILLLGFFTVIVVLGASTKVSKRVLKTLRKNVLYQEYFGKNGRDLVAHKIGKARNKGVKILLHTVAIQTGNYLPFLLFG